MIVATAVVSLAWSATASLGPVTLGTPTLFALVGGALWMILLAGTGSYDLSIFEVPDQELRRVLLASVLMLAGVATAGLLLEWGHLRGYVLLGIPLGSGLLVMSRAWMGRRLQEQRRRGEALTRAVIIGEEPGSSVTAAEIRRGHRAGLVVVDTLAPPSEEEDVQTWAHAVYDRTLRRDAAAVVLTSHPALQRHVVSALAWRLEGQGMDLLVAANFAAVPGARISIRRAAGLPLIHLHEPLINGPKRLFKRAIDVVGSLAALVLFAPVLAVSAIAVRLSSPGPAMFRQVRVGAGGEEFRVFKFRTMVQGAAARQDEVWAQGLLEGTANKSRTDPRVTDVGRILRRWSVDELPQLFNVLLGDMSLVGPRPLQPSEVKNLPDEHDRRHLTKPGMTGLWQVSGRNDLPWDERMRLDLQYVEHWSVSLDLLIMLRTVKAVLVGSGAY